MGGNTSRLAAKANGMRFRISSSTFLFLSMLFIVSPLLSPMNTPLLMDCLVAGEILPVHLLYVYWELNRTDKIFFN